MPGATVIESNTALEGAASENGTTAHEGSSAHEGSAPHYSTTAHEGSGVPARGAVTGRAAPRMRADARRSRARLIEAATAAFAENGADAPLDDIARRAGVGIGTLYRHFPTRLDLQAMVYRSQVVNVCGQADDLMASTPPEQAFAAWLRSLAAYLVTKRGLSRAVIDSLGRDSELVSSCYVAMRETVERLLAAGQRAGALRPDLTASDVLYLVHGIGVATERAPEDTDRLLSLILDGMRPRDQVPGKGGDQE